ncbi:hypothetical protein L2E82_18683 [Cichorium intybus]|uniref:Uncharacterized protein n=1 Tax=Cichorium intybus TaxID=13427 RepID=A0ACB9FAN0_CICIN|nr:hypothetical protein L2E82_18683 [Cichorium intybus]
MVTIEAFNSHSNFYKDMVISSRKVEFKIKSDCDVFYQLFSARPKEVCNLTPANIQNCQILEGEVGTVGSVLLWNYFHEGKDCVFKVLVEEIDNEKKHKYSGVKVSSLVDPYWLSVLKH